jgi:predicted RNase H-like nuclease (RuvC/YqgF family)
MEPRKSTKSVTTLQNENSHLRKFVTALKSENAKLQKKVARLEANDVTSSNRIKALEKLKVIPERKPSDIRDVARRIAFTLNQGDVERIDGKFVQVNPSLGQP